MTNISIQSALVCVLLFGFGNASVISKNEASTLVSLTIDSAKINPPTDAIWKARVYGLDINKPLKLPINSTETKGITYVQYETQYVQSSGTPTWDRTFSFSSDLFTEQSWIAIEVHGVTVQNFTASQPFYTGGTEFTVEMLRNFSHTKKLILSDQAGDSPGTIDIAWQ